MASRPPVGRPPVGRPPVGRHRIGPQLANILTVLRILLVPFFVLSLFGSSTGSGALALGLFLLASLSDYFDGYIARRLGKQSRFGEFLDPLADKILTGSAFVVFAFTPGLGVPVWLVAVILLREALVTLFRMLAIRKGRPIETEFTGKIKTAFQMVSIVFVLALLLATKVIASRGTGSVPWVGGALSDTVNVLDAARVPFILVATSAALALLSMAHYLMKNWNAIFPLPAARLGRKMIDGVVLFLSTGCFVGYISRGSGTIATVLGSLIWLLCSKSPFTYLVGALVVVVGFFSADYAEKHLFKEKDSQRIVIDEIAGILVTFLGFSFSFTVHGFVLYILGIALFRAFDILKPPPIRLLQRLKGGAGVLFDDLAAGAFANAVLQLFRCVEILLTSIK